MPWFLTGTGPRPVGWGPLVVDDHLPVSSHGLSSVHVSVLFFSSYEDTGHIGSRPTAMTFSLNYSLMTLSPSASHILNILEVRTSTNGFEGDTIQPIIPTKMFKKISVHRYVWLKKEHPISHA